MEMADNQGHRCCSIDELEQDDRNWQTRRINKAKRSKEVKESGEKWNVVVRFEEPGVKSVDPIKLMKIIKNQVGEVKYARILNYSNL